MRYLSSICLFIVVLFSSIHGFSQSDGISVIGKVKENTILLRWAGVTPMTWQQENKYGVVIERFTIVQNGELIENVPQTKVRCISNPLKPAPLNQWEKFVEEDDYAAVAAQAIYGNSFETESEDGLISKLRGASELELRHSFALYAADNSMKVAELSGLFFQDSSVEAHSKYLYKIYVPSKEIRMDTGLVYLNTDEVIPIPKPGDVGANFSEKIVELSWNTKYYSDIFSAYFIERSTNGIDFKRLSEENIVIVDDKNGEVPDRGEYYDSIPDPDQEYFYQVRGITPFGEISPPSKIVKGKAKLTIKGFNPEIVNTNANDANTVQIKWTFPQERTHLLKGFRVLNALQMEGPFNPIHDDLLPPTQYEYIDTTASQTSYYMIEAEDIHENTTLSFFRLVQPIDTLPPLTPQKIKIQADTSGLVYFSWKKGDENDLKGYRIYTANHPEEEFTEITKDVWTDTTYIDTLNLNTLTEKVYYKVLALDNRYNRSVENQIIEVQRPDILPPVSPVISNYESEEGYISFEWIPSTSTDVVRHQIARKDYQMAEWKIIHQVDSGQAVTDSIGLQYIDSLNLEAGKGYWYKIEAVDEVGNVSEPAILKTQTLDRKIKPAVSIDLQLDRKKHFIRLDWTKYNLIGVERFIIYRAEEGKPLKAYKTVQGVQKEYVDQNPTINKTYQYMVQARFFNGAESELSNPKSIKY